MASSPLAVRMPDASPRPSIPLTKHSSATVADAAQVKRRGHRVKNAARLLDISPGSVWKLLREKKIESVMIAGCRIIPDDQIEKLLAAK